MQASKICRPAGPLRNTVLQMLSSFVSTSRYACAKAFHSSMSLSLASLPPFFQAASHAHAPRSSYASRGYCNRSFLRYFLGPITVQLRRHFHSRGYSDVGLTNYPILKGMGKGYKTPFEREDGINFLYR